MAKPDADGPGAGAERTGAAGPGSGAPAGAGAGARAGTGRAQAAGRWQDNPLSGTAPAPLDPDRHCRYMAILNAQYHARREAWLDTVHRWFMFLIILCGCVAIVDILPKDVLAHGKEWLTALAVVLAALDLTFDLSNRARAHGLMRRRYFELLADFTKGNLLATEAMARMDSFSADEEPLFRALYLTCYNSAQEAVFGDNAERYIVPWYYGITKNWLRFGGVTFKHVAVPNEEKMA